MSTESLATQSASMDTSDLRSAVRAAAKWYARLHSGLADDSERVAWERWLDASPEHRSAWLEIEKALQQLDQVPAHIASPLLQQSSQSRRELLRKLAMLATLAPLPWLVSRSAPWQQWRADFSTATGERKPLTLPDGSSLELNTDSAVDVEFTPTQRLILLRRGEIAIATAANGQSTTRPFFVQTRQGRAQALGTRFTVLTTDGRTKVSVQQSAVQVIPVSAPQETRVVHEGQQVTFHANGSEMPIPAPIAASSWLNGSLVIVNLPLGQMVEELSRYRIGVISCDPAIAHLKISGAFPIDDTDRALRMISATFPVREQRLTSYYVRMVPV